MTNVTATYKRLGDYIREVDVRNKDLRCTNLLGLSIAKKFIPSIANTIGTDLRSYKIVKQSQFAYVPVTSRNGEKITVALYSGDEPAIISQAYVVFEIVDMCDSVETVCTPSLQLLPEYLMMWFRRPEFDRYARFHSHGSAREVFDWEELCDVMLPIPSLEEQRRIVNRYQAIENRIANNKQTIAKLEEAAQALYRKMFVDGTPKGTLKEICYNFSGYPFDGETYSSEDGIIALRGENVTENALRWDTIKKYNGSITDRISKCYLKEWDIVIGMDGSKVGKNWSFVYDYNLPLLLAQRVACLRSDSIEKQIFAYLSITMEHFAEYVSQVNTGSTILHISSTQIDEFPVPLPSEQQFIEIKREIVPLFKGIKVCLQENEKLTEMLSLLMVGI